MPATLSYSTQVFARQPFEAALHWARRIGLDAVEIGREHAEQLHVSDAARASARRLAESLAVRFASLHAWSGIDSLADVCPTCESLGVGLIVVHCPHDELVGGPERCADTLARWCDWCDSRGIVLTVENASSQRIEPFAALFAAVPALRFTLDVKHAYKPQRFRRTHADYMAALADRLANFHLLGIDPARDDVLGDGIPAGHDAVDWPALAGELADRRYAGLLTAECSIPDDPADVLERAYFDLPKADADAPTLSHRLSRHNVEHFRRQFQSVL